MAANKLDKNTGNNNTGLYFTSSGRVTIDVPIGEIATWIKCTTAGDIVWINDETNEIGVWSLEAGETAPIAFTRILTNGTVRGTLETTTATGLYWATSASDYGNARR